MSSRTAATAQRTKPSERAALLQLFKGYKSATSTIDVERAVENFRLRSFLHSINDLARVQELGPIGTRGELDLCADLAARWVQHVMERMHKPALQAIEKRTGKPLIKIADDVWRAMVAAREARDSAEIKLLRRVAGPRRQRHAQGVTVAAANAFRALTGKQPRGKQFEGFLDCVFAILRIEASAAGQIKLMPRARRAQK